MKLKDAKITRAIIFCVIVLACNLAQGQQYNSDNYLSKPCGTSTIILTYGQRSDIIMTTFSLFRNWEFTTAVYIYNKDNNPNTADGYSTTFYFKWMLYENPAQTGGIAFKGGTGLYPGLQNDSVSLGNAFKSYWVNAPLTLPFFKNKLSWDIMPGASYTTKYGTEGNPAWGFTYSTRLAYYPFSPKLSLVGEVFGAAGQAFSKPEYKVGLRWEPNQYAVFAVTYGQEFKGSEGAGLEIGIMLFTPPFCCLGKSHKKQSGK